jgi:DNA-binding MarR family transcriptional regulator
MPLNAPTDCPYYLISRVTLVVTAALKKGFARSGVNRVKPAYLGVLISLWADDGLKVVELGRRSGLEPSTMTGLLDRMERDGLVKRTADPADRRAHRICLTDDGIKARRPVMEVVNQILAGVFYDIPKDALDTTKDVLRHILSNSNKEIRA